MKNDICRNTFDPTKHFSRLLRLQGRVDLAADWNEQTSILLHYLRTLATDIIGADGGPADRCGFEIINALGASVIAALKGKDINAAGFFIGPGRYYVDGLLCENEGYADYLGQPDWWPLSEDEKKLKDGSHLVYLDVWERLITAVEDDSIREVALGGPDTATRAKVVWQVKLLPLPGSTAVTDRSTAVTALTNAKKRELPLLRAQLEPKPTSSDPCILSSDSRYRGAENQLYRVEIHSVDENGNATFKWSRENGSVVFPVINVASDSAGNNTVVTLAHLGRDAHLGLAEGDWVELVDDSTVLHEQNNPLLRVQSIQREDGTVTLSGTAKFPIEPKMHALLRRWDHPAGDKDHGAVQVVQPDKAIPHWLNLEDGVQIQFMNGGLFRTGDYWLIPARTADRAGGANGMVEWPKAEDGSSPAEQPPRGIVHHYAPLAVITVATGAVAVTDYRRGFVPLQDLAPPIPRASNAAPDRLE